MTVSTAERLAKIHAEALEEFDRIQSAVRDERLQCLQDRRFYSIAGAQWEGALGDQFENRPKFEVNKVHLAVLRIINEYRNNRITVDFQSKDGSENEALADTCDGLYRADEQDSVAEEAYDNAFEEAVGGGFGAWRLRAVYEDEEDPDNEFQRIRIEPIYDADSCVFFDLDAKRQDKSDAKRCFVLSSMTVEDYKAEWGDDPASWPKEISQREFDWSTPDLVYVAEYYRVEESKDEIVVFVDLEGKEERYRASELKEDEELLDRLEATGRKEIRRKRIKTRVVHKYILSGGKTLEDCGLIAGNQIPVVPTYGKRWFVDSVERCMGHVRLSKDPQQLKNMQLSKLGELSAYSSVSKPIFTPEQMAGHQVMWAEDNIKGYPYLLVNAITDANGQQMPAGPVAYTKAPEIPQALAALLQLTDQDMREILGSPENAEKVVSNVSGKTVELVQQRLDMQTFIYMSNMAKAIRRCGQIWFGMAQELYTDKGRKMKKVGSHGETGSIELLQPKANPETGENIIENDLGSAALEVTVEVGPSSRSRRDSTVKSLMSMLAVTTDPDTQQVLQSMIMLNIEGEGISETRNYFRMKLVRMGVLKPTDEEKKELEALKAAQGKDPNAAYLEAAADQASADAVASRVKVLETLAAAELKRAQTAETLAGIDQTNRQQVIDMASQVIQPRDAQPFDPRKAAQQDVIPAAISVNEDRMLRKQGGAGVLGPDGLMHYYQDRGDGTDGHQGAGDNDAGGADGTGEGGVGGNGEGSGGRSRQNDYNGRQDAIDNANYNDVNAERAARFAGAGSVDPDAVNAGLAYGIDEGDRTHSWANFRQGFKAAQAGGPTAGVIGGAIRAAIGDPGSPEVNGGGWGNLGPSGQSPSGLGGGGQMVDGNNGGNGLGGSQIALGQVQAGTAAGQTSTTTGTTAAYQARVPVELWSTLDPDARAKAMQEFWKQF